LSGSFAANSPKRLISAPLGNAAAHPNCSINPNGRWTFHVLAWTEWGFVVATAVLIAIVWRSGRAGIGLAASRPSHSN
jgi:hypothetical protein